jgi:hypothetical protein
VVSDDSFEDRLARSGVTAEYVEMTTRQNRMNDWLDRVLPESMLDSAPSSRDPKGFGEVSVDASIGVITVWWKGDVPDDVRTALSDPPDEMSVLIESVAYSRRQLESAVDRVIGGRRSLDAEMFAAGVHSLEADVAGGRVVVGYQDPQVGAGVEVDPVELEARRVELEAKVTDRARVPVTLIHRGGPVAL